MNIDKEYYREKFLKVIDDFRVFDCEYSEFFPLDEYEKESLLRELMKCFEDEK